MMPKSKQIPVVLDGRNELMRVRFRLLPVPEQSAEYEMKKWVLVEIASPESVRCLRHSIE